jgi:hypothetical protein
MNFVLQPWQLLLAILAGWINRQQQEVIEYLWVPKTSSAGRIDAKRAGERPALSKAPRWHQEAVWTERRPFGAGSLPPMSSRKYEQAFHNGIFGMDKRKR